MTFEELNLRPQLLKTIGACGYESPTPIQGRAIPPALEGRDVMGLAQTGTGKTAAFVLPILQRMMQGPRGRVRALIVAPTRELAGQIQEVIEALGRNARISSVAIYGGVGMGPQIQKFRRGADIVVACPGRLLDYLRRGGIVDLSRVEVLVLDEADRMFDMGFLPDVRRIMGFLPEKRQTLFFSATMPPEIRRLADDMLSDPAVVQIKHIAPADTVSHALFPVRQHLKTNLLTEILRQNTDAGSVLVFTRTKQRAKRLAEHLEKTGYSAASLQGNLSQNRRQEALDGFRDGSYKVLVATDIAARGIDVSRISHVINYDMPDTTDAYTHRIGRTGRAERTGDAFTFVTPEDRAMVFAIERLLGKMPELRKLPDFDYSAPAPAGAALERPARRQFGPRGKSGGRGGESRASGHARPRGTRAAHGSERDSR